MSGRPPAQPGDPIAAIDTPALVVDLAVFDANIGAMAQAVAARGLRLRPHAKAHKCPDIAVRQIAAGAIGICCQKTDEAAAFAAAGVRDILVTNEVVLPAKLARLAALARDARIGVLCDNAGNVAALQHAAAAASVTLDVYVEVDVGARRCGVAPGAPAAALAQAVAAQPALRFAGLHCYHGGAQHLRRPDQRRAAIESAAQDASESRTACERAGVSVSVVTGAGTGTWEHEAASGVWNELQPGSYPFMDADYARNIAEPGALRFAHSLFVVASVMSVPARERAVCDAGLKAFSFDSGVPRVHARDGLEYEKASDEHGVLAVAPDAAPPALGERVWLVPGHCDPTVNLYDWIVGVRNARVECVWPVSARGALG